MTLDRDIRFTPDQISVTQAALRDEIARRTRSIKNAEAARARGDRIKHGTLQNHYECRDHARQVLDNLEAALKAIARRITDQLGTTPPDEPDAARALDELAAELVSLATFARAEPTDTGRARLYDQADGFARRANRLGYPSVADQIGRRALADLQTWDGRGFALEQAAASLRTFAEAHRS